MHVCCDILVWIIWNRALSPMRRVWRRTGVNGIEWICEKNAYKQGGTAGIPVPMGISFPAFSISY